MVRFIKGSAYTQKYTVYHNSLLKTVYSKLFINFGKTNLFFLWNAQYVHNIRLIMRHMSNLKSDFSYTSINKTGIIYVTAFSILRVKSGKTLHSKGAKNGHPIFNIFVKRKSYSSNSFWDFWVQEQHNVHEFTVCHVTLKVRNKKAICANVVM